MCCVVCVSSYTMKGLLGGRPIVCESWLEEGGGGITFFCRQYCSSTICACAPACSPPLALFSQHKSTKTDQLGVPRGTIRATVLIETITAAFEMEEIIYELRAHSAGLNCGRWDYIFSFIKKFRNHSRMVLPNRCGWLVVLVGAVGMLVCASVWVWVRKCRR